MLAASRYIRRERLPHKFSPTAGTGTAVPGASLGSTETTTTNKMIVGDKLPPMPSNKKKIKSKQSTSKGKLAVSKKETAHSKRVVTAKIPKNVTKKPTAPKTMTSAVASRKKRTSVSTEREIKEEIKNRNLTTAGSASGRQSGDLQGLSRAEQANSESVDELVEEGNLFEAGAVAGVEEADSADEREVHTHELSEDDVPQEYLDKE